MNAKASAPYEPRGIPKAVIDHLRTLPRGTKVPSAELAEMVGVTPPGEIHSLLDYAVRKGAIVKLRDPADKRRQLWMLGDGKPLERSADAEPDEPDEPRQRVLSPSEWMRRPPASAEPSPEAAPTERPTRGTRRPALRLALFSDGELVIERGAERVSFTEPETRQICAYLDRLAPTPAD